MPYATLKIFLNIVWSRLEPKDPTITAAGAYTSKFVRLTFSHRRLSVYPSFVELSGEISYELEQKLSVLPKSRC